MARIRGTARADILAAARRLLETAPFDDLTLGRVAEEAKASRQSVYRLFGSRHGLLLALVATSLLAQDLPGLKVTFVAGDKTDRRSERLLALYAPAGRR